MKPTKGALFDEANIAIRNYLDHCGWKLFDRELLTENMFFVIDPITGQNLPIDYAYTIQTSRDLYDKVQKK